MGGFMLKKHRVRESNFSENLEVKKKNNIEVSVEGGILIPKALSDSNKNIVVQLKFQIGGKDERLYLQLETLSSFEPENSMSEITEEIARKECLPVALAQLRKTVKKVTEAYGMPSLDLPPFEEENL
mgnify:CR=1 FL=1